MRILFSMRNFWDVKLFEPVVRELAARGHHLHILAERGERSDRARDWNDAAMALAAESASVTFGWAPWQVEDDWVDLRAMVRLGLDHLRFLSPAYADAPMLGNRARRRTPRGLVRLADAPLLRTRLGRRGLSRALKIVERAIPTGDQLSQAIESHRADVVLVTPLITLGSEQIDVVRTARRLGVPTALCVGSWDHLSSKALIRQWPDRVFVWNETQREEAMAYHGVPTDRVIVTGAQCFDQWFGREPSRGRESFCRRVGLDPNRPYVLYVCSALFEGSPNEAAFVVQWARALRTSSDPLVREAGILVRPHPKRGFEWSDVSLEDIGHAVLWPTDAAAPFDVPSKNDYFDSMFHSAAIVGLNSSALIEGGIVGRPVHTLLLPEFRDNQEGTLHFRYLLDGGLLRAARNLAEHVELLAASVATSDPAVHHNRRFVERFVRPRGLNQAATPVFADAVEGLAMLAPRPQPDPWWIRGLRVLLAPVARATSGTFVDQVGRERRRRHKVRVRAERIQLLEAQRGEEKMRNVEQRHARREAEAQRRSGALADARAQKRRQKELVRATKQRDRDRRVAQAHRRRWRVAIRERLSRYVRRVTGMFSSSR